ncbi:Uncharacterised protein [Porphyromonas cangingivalis]|uniref:Uncharacterized protein n=1 Tax=Porphyromonas cangingivalis TaxID=36874 RepID=A0A1T4JTI3_PORCN|nr:hypothetical protein SAMN02745205_00388 [Porphyromonas cangingivalis]SPY36091.1 Uncharacterised protein [Porphyromonas cangingivalis]VEJ04750.1 Uncharacterised protein [Porphyromonas cangingivalis]
MDFFSLAYCENKKSSYLCNHFARARDNNEIIDILNEGQLKIDK